MRTLFVLSLLTLSTAAVDLASDLKDALTFHAAFHGTTDASVALGDKRLFVAPSYKEQSAARTGLSGNTVHLITFLCYSVFGAEASRRRSSHARYRRGFNHARDGCLRQSPRTVAVGVS